MKKITFLIFLSLILFPITAEDNINEMNSAQLFDLAMAYDQVSDKYMELDDTSERADSYKKMADLLRQMADDHAQSLMANNPEIDPVVIENPEPEIPQDADELAARGINYFFKKYMSAFSRKNSDEILRLTNEPFNLAYYGEVTSDSLTDFLEEIFSVASFDDKDYSEIFMTDSITIEVLEEGYYRLDVTLFEEYSNLSDVLAVWGLNHSYYFRKTENVWYIEGAVIQ